MELRLIVDFDSPLHHGSGYGLAGVVDRAVLRDAKGIPYLAGSALKGKFRYAASLILRSRGDRRCGPPDNDYCRADFCQLCVIFGSPLNAGSAIFEDAYPMERSLMNAITQGSRFSVHSPDSEVRINTALDRHTRTVKPRHLFSTETITILRAFEGRIRGGLTLEQRDLLSNCATLLDHFGSSSSRGLGRCSYSVAEVER